MSPRAQRIAAGLAGFTAVAIGAFAAHGLKGHLSASALLTFQTGVHYHLAHALVLLALSLAPTTRWLRAASVAFSAGIVLFSGSLYVLALSGLSWLGAVTPFGGIALLAGWVFVLLSAAQLTVLQARK